MIQPSQTKKSPITINVLANDTDLDGDTLTVTGVTDGANGTVTIDDPLTGEVTYTPDPDFDGPEDSFTYTISDGTGTDTATVTVTVNPLNDAPDAVDDSTDQFGERLRPKCTDHPSMCCSCFQRYGPRSGDTLTVTGVTEGPTVRLPSTDHGRCHLHPGSRLVRKTVSPTPSAMARVEPTRQPLRSR